MKDAHKPTVIAIACIRKHDQAIGSNGNLLFGIREDMDFFKTQTMGHPVIMGRKNWDSIPERYRPLINRFNIVMTRNAELELPEDVIKAGELDLAILQATAVQSGKIFIIGGGQIYEQALDDKDLVDEVVLTVVSDGYGPNADSFFYPTHEWKDKFSEPEIVKTWEKLVDWKTKREYHDVCVLRYVRK